MSNDLSPQKRLSSYSDFLNFIDDKDDYQRLLKLIFLGPRRPNSFEQLSPFELAEKLLFDEEWLDACLQATEHNWPEVYWKFHNLHQQYGRVRNESDYAEPWAKNSNDYVKANSTDKVRDVLTFIKPPENKRIIIVISNGKPIGFLTLIDVLKLGKSQHNATLSQVMKVPVETQRSAAPMRDIKKYLLDSGRDEAIIVNDQGKLMGIVTMNEVVAWESE